MKKVLMIIISMIFMIAMCSVMAFGASKEMICTEFTITEVMIPDEGEDPSSATYTTASVPEGKGYKVSDILWFTEDGQPVQSVFSADTIYKARILLEPTSDNLVVIDESIKATINGKAATYVGDMELNGGKVWMVDFYFGKSLDTPKQIKASNLEFTGEPKVTWNPVEGATGYEIWRKIGKNGVYSRIYATKSSSYINSTSQVGTAYYYKVVAIDKTGIYKASGFSQEVRIVRKCVRPELTISTLEIPGKPYLSWNSINDASRYEIYRSTSQSGKYTKLDTVADFGYDDMSAVAGVRYYYKIKAVCGKTAEGNSAFSKVKSKLCVCAQPKVQMSNKADSGKPYLDWGKISNASNYEVYRSTSKSGSYKKINSTTNSYYTDTTAVAGNKYYYKVKAICKKTKEGNSAFSDIVFRTCDCKRPIINLSLKSGKPRLKWEEVSNASKYEIYYATSKNGNYKKLKTTTKTSYTHTGAKKGKTYYYKVKAICKKTSNGNSAYSKVKNITSK